LSSILDKENVLNGSKTDFNDYCGSPEYHSDLAHGLTPSTKSTFTLLQAGKPIASEFRRCIKREDTHYAELKDDKNFNTWNCIIVATAFMRHTQSVLNEDYVPIQLNMVFS
jgi:hypothetical protein